MYTNKESQESFEELPIVCVRSGIYRDVPYQVGVVPRQVDQSTFEYSHYTGYICVQRLIENVEQEYNQDTLSDQSFTQPPRIPSNISYGLTEDGWIGTGTMRSEIFNYTCSYKPFKQDTRIEESKLFYDTPQWITANDMEDILKEWIDRIYDKFTPD